MKKLFLLVSLFALFLGSQNVVQAQTPGTLTFSVTTTEPAGNYNSVNVIALWVEDTNGVFVKTKVRYAGTRIQYLTKWITSSSYSTVDAVTGATRAGHGALTFTWNATNVGGSVVIDKPYRVYLQMSDANAAGQWTYVEFVKDTNTFTVNPSNIGNFTNMSLSWVPSDVSVNEAEGVKMNFDCTPNPVKDMASISYTLDRTADVTITLHDITGKNIAVVADGNRAAGSHTFNWNVSEISNLTSGVYYLRINTGRAVAVKKIVVTR